MSINRDELFAALDQTETNQLAPLESRRSAIKGLPDEDALKELAKTYLENQRKHFPELIEKGILPEPNPKVLAEMAAQFKDIFVSGEIPALPMKVLQCGFQKFGACYSRYSDDNSNERSLNQQLQNELTGAAGEMIFIPWQFVFADAAVTGTIASRRGYQLIKSLIGQPDHIVSNFFIDELGRASRDHIESLSLGRLVEKSGNRLVGVSDGFDSEQAMSKVMLSIFAMLHELFIDQLREKVNRGMNDAFEQGKHLYKPAFGYRLQTTLDKNGQPKTTKEGKLLNEVVIDEAEAEQVRRVFDLYTNQRLSPLAIAKMYNSEGIGDDASWNDYRIREMLQRTMYMGIETWGKTRNEYDPKTGKRTTITVPEEARKTREVPHLRIIDQELWNRTQLRWKEASRVFDHSPGEDSKTRQEVYAKRLFNLFCHDCQSPLWCERGGERPIVMCKKGKHGRSDCSSSGGKTLQHIEESILNEILTRFGTEEFLEAILESANAFAMEMVEEPPPETEHLWDQLAKLKKTQAKMVKLIEAQEDPTMLSALSARVASLQVEINEVDEKLSLARTPQGDVEPITRSQLLDLMNPLRELLMEDKENAAKVLSKVVGRVYLEQTKVEGKKRPVWYAHFSIDASPVLLEIAKQQHCPTTQYWELLSSGSWTNGVPTTCEIRMLSRMHRIAWKVRELVNGGAKLQAIESQLRIDPRTTKAAFAYAKNHPLQAKLLSSNYKREQFMDAKYLQIANDVDRLLGEKKTPDEIAVQLGVSIPTVNRSIDHVRPNQVREAVERGTSIKRTNRSRLPEEAYQQIEEKLKAGMPIRQICRETGRDRSTVRRVRDQNLRNRALVSP